MSASLTALADALVAARARHALLAAVDWTDTLADAAQAYAVQDAVAAGCGWFQGGTARFWKSGGGSREAPLTHAPLPQAGVRESPADFSGWPLHAPGIEGEIALRLAEDVTPARAASLAAGASAQGLVDAMAVSIEIVDSRWQEAGQAPALLRLADQQSHGGLVLGAWVPWAEGRNWAAQRCAVHIGAQAALVCTGTHALGDPAWLLPLWLAHATRDGSTLQAGTVVTTGTWVGLLPAQRGDEVRVVFDGIGEARLRL